MCTQGSLERIAVKAVERYIQGQKVPIDESYTRRPHRDEPPYANDGMVVGGEQKARSKCR